MDILARTVLFLGPVKVVEQGLQANVRLPSYFAEGRRVFFAIGRSAGLA